MCWDRADNCPEQRWCGDRKLPCHAFGNVDMVNRNCAGIQLSIRTLELLGAIHQAEELKQTLIGCSESSVSEDPREETPQSPSMMIRGLNFASAMAAHAVDGFRRRSQSEIDSRLAICQACPHLVDNHCQLCGCPCVKSNQLLNKLALASESCPLGQWT